MVEIGRRKAFLHQLFAVSGVIFYMIGTGANIAFPGVLLQQLREPDTAITLTVEHESWVASVLGLALMTGIIVSPILLEKLGRKLTNQLSTLPALAGWALMTMAASPHVLLISRFLQGFGMGLQAPAAPVSIAEYSSPTHRGAFLATIAFSFSTGMLIAHLFGTMLYWRPASLACGSCYVISLIIITLTPETPSWLAAHGRYEKCKQSFRWLRGCDANSEKELEVLLNSQKDRRSLDVGKDRKQSKCQRFCAFVKKKEFYKPTLIMMFLFVMFQTSGMTVIPSYTGFIMDEVTSGKMDVYSAMLAVDFVRFFTGILACVIVNKYPRRTVLFTGVFITVLALLVTSLLLYLKDFGYIPEEYHWVPVIPTLVYIFGKTISILPIPWAIAGEIFPLAYRGIGSGIAGMVLSLMFFVVVKTAPNSFAIIGVKGTFCVYAVTVALCAGFLYFLLPETRGKTLHDIEYFFKGEQLDLNGKGLEGVRMLKLDEIEGG